MKDLTKTGTVLTRNWCTVETSPEKAQETLLKQTIHYASPRIDFYVESLRHEFSRKPRVQPPNPSKIQKLVAAATNPSRSLKSWSDEAWRDYKFATAGSETNDQDRASDEIDRLSCDVHEETYEGVRRDSNLLFQRVLGFCKTTGRLLKILLRLLSRLSSCKPM